MLVLEYDQKHFTDDFPERYWVEPRRLLYFEPNCGIVTFRRSLGEADGKKVLFV